MSDPSPPLTGIMFIGANIRAVASSVGRSYKSNGLPVCTILPPRMTKTTSPQTRASCGSCVTIIVTVCDSQSRRGVISRTSSRKLTSRLENGYIESFNGKLRDELLAREWFNTLLEAKVLIERWRRHFNTVRPHSSLGYVPPAPETNQPCFFSEA